MSTELVPFEFAGVSRNAVREGEEFFFIVKEVCDAIEHTDPHKFVATIDKKYLTGKTFLSGGQNREMLCIAEKGLYIALMRSSKPKAKPFQERVANLLQQLRIKGVVDIRPDSDAPVTRADFNTLNSKLDRVLESSEKTMKMMTEAFESWKHTPNLSLKAIKANADLLSLKQYFELRGWAWGTNGITNQSLGRVVANVYRAEYGEDPVFRYDGSEGERTVYPQDFLNRYFNARVLGDGKDKK